jgi:parallel beta-helix repeat protein
MKTDRRRLLVLSTVALMTTVAILPSTTAGATDGVLYLTEKTRLSTDHFGSIDIVADGVTLDCDGHSIVNPGFYPFGITVIGQSKVTVKNCHISGFIEGISLTDTSDSTVVDNTFRDNTESVVLFLGATGNVVKNNLIEDSGIGVRVVDGPNNNVIKDNFLSDNERGIHVVNSSGTVIKGNTAVNNTTDGISAFFSSGTKIGENTSSANGLSGIAVFQSDSSRVWENVTDGNGNHGVFAVVTDGTGSRFWENEGCGNAIVDGRDRSAAFGLDPAEWRENTFCTFLIDQS